MNTTQHQGEWNILNGATAVGSLAPSADGINALLTKAGQQVRSFSKAAAALFLRRHAVSSLRVTWAGILRSDSDRLVPEPSEEIRFHVAHQMFLCEEGKPLVFDESWNQEAWGHTNGYRVVFLTDSARVRKAPLRKRIEKFFMRLVQP